MKANNDSLCPYKECKHDHYDYRWLDEVLFLKLALDLTLEEGTTQYPLVPFKDLHQARAEVIAHIKAKQEELLDRVEKEVIQPDIELPTHEDFDVNQTSSLKQAVKDVLVINTVKAEQRKALDKIRDIYANYNL